MIIAIDASRANQPQRTGPASYAFNLLQAMKTYTSVGIEVVLLTDQPLNKSFGQLPLSWRNKVLHWPFSRGWTKYRLPYELRCGRYDIFWQPTAGLPKLPPATKGVITIHDIAFLEAPHVYSPQDLIRQHQAFKGANNAQTIITISEYSRELLLKHLKLGPQKIIVTPLAADEDIRWINDQQKINEVKHKYGITQPYFITVGRVEKKKGITEIIEALHQLDNNYDLLLVGRLGFGAEEVVALIKKYHLEERVKILGWVDNQDLSALLSSATAYISACRYEGFGIAVLDALKCGCPVVAYKAGAIPETVGEATLLVDPSGPQALTGGLNKLISQPELGRKLSQDGLYRAQQFSWQKTAELTWRGIIGL